MRTKILVFGTLGVVTSVSPCIADVLHVPGDHATIQAALNAALDGDEIVVQPGTYPEMIDMLGKRVTLRSASGDKATIIQAVGLGPVVRCDSGETAETLVDGFTITGSDSGQGSFYIASSNPTVRSCTIADNFGNQGAGMLLSASDSLIQHCVFVRNRCGIGSSGAGMAVTDGGHPIIEDCTFEENIAPSGGGGIVVRETSEPTIRRCVFRLNQAGQGSSAGAGGGMRIDLNAAATVIDCVFDSNTAHLSLGGGGVRCSGLSNFTGCVFRNNTPNGLQKERNGVFTRCTFEDNAVGTLVSANVSAPAFVDCAFISNSSHGFETDTAFPTLIRCRSEDNGGAGFRSHRSGTVLTDCIARGNAVRGLWSTQGGSAPEIFERVTNCLFVNNGDSGVFASRSRALLTNCTIASNAGPGLSINVGIPGVALLVPRLHNCVSWANALGTFAGDLPVASHCLTQTALAGTANIVSDPLFANSAEGDFQLSKDSPAIDSGDDAALPPGTLTDLAGNQRIADGDLDGTATVDRGAYEFQPVVAIDIRPGACPNPLNRRSNGVIPVAVACDSRFDVHDINIATVRLARSDGIGYPVAPNEGRPGPHTTIADVATPLVGEACACHTLTTDGTLDLLMKFRVSDLVDAMQLDQLPAGAVVPMTFTAMLTNGTQIRGFDCVRLVSVDTSPGLFRMSDPRLPD